MNNKSHKSENYDVVIIGVAESIADNIKDWPELIEKADSRMYQAKLVPSYAETRK